MEAEPASGELVRLASAGRVVAVQAAASAVMAGWGLVSAGVRAASGKAVRESGGMGPVASRVEAAAVRVANGAAVRVSEAVRVGNGAAVRVSAAVRVGNGVAVRVSEAVRVGNGVAVRVSEAVRVGNGVAVRANGVGAGRTGPGAARRPGQPTRFGWRSGDAASSCTVIPASWS